MAGNSERISTRHFLISSRFSSRRFFFVACLLISLMTFAGCGGGKGNDNSNPPANVGGGFTLVVSGGTLNDGSGVNGLSVLATLRDSQGWGPTQTWIITITDPDNNSFTVEYNDPRLGSYMSWEWAALNPVPGTYTATATNGVTTIHYNFTVTSTVLSRPAPNATALGGDITVTWPSVGAGSYSWVACAPDSTCLTGFTTSTSDIASFGTPTPGDYLIEVKAYATDRIALFANHSSSPQLAPQEKVSEYFFTFPIGGDQAPSDYSLTAAAGVLDYGLRGPGSTPIYGLAIWTSIQDITSHPTDTAPAGDWNIIITDPNGLVMNYLYPAGDRHYAYWYYGIEPVVGTYHMLATYGTASITATFSLGNTPPALAPLLYSQISGTLVSNVTNTTVNDISISWPAVTNANSYYVSLYADVWNSSSKQYEYTEVWNDWVNTTSTRVLNGSVATGLQCDVYLTAYQVDMTSAAPPATAPTRADMSENYYGYPLPFWTP